MRSRIVYRDSHRRSLALFAVIVACALWVGYISSWGKRAPLTQTQQALPDASLEEIRLAPDFEPLRPGQDLKETTARSLFNPSRRPPTGEARVVSPGSGTSTQGRYALTGVSISGRQRVALLREVATDRTVRVEQHKEVDGVLVESVTSTKVTLKHGAEREELPLRIAPASMIIAEKAASRDQSGADAQAVAREPRAPVQPPAAAPLPGPPRTAIDIANADPITEAEVAEAKARNRAKRKLQSSPWERSPK